MKKLHIIIIFTLFLGNILSAQNYSEPKPKLYLTPTDIARAKDQIKSCPELKSTYDALLKNQKALIENWRKSRKGTNKTYTTQEILDLGADGRLFADYMAYATAYVLSPSFEAAQIVREALMGEISYSIHNGAWRTSGIHEGERAHRFLAAYDLIANTGILSQEEQQIIAAEFRKIGLFLQGSILDGPLSPVFQGQTYCFNIYYYPACMIGVIGMYFPEIPESKEWIETAQHDVKRFFFTENFLDGAYGEGSVHYFHPTMDGVIQYIKAAQNLGYADFMKDPAFARAFSQSFKWRMNLTAPDGRKMAIGDAHRSPVGANLIEAAASLLNDGDLAWTARTIIERANGGNLIHPYNLLEIDMSLKATPPTHLYSNYIWGGFTFFRSGWDSNANFMAFKYGPTYAGRREIESYAVIPGHANEDCMEMELHYKGIPIFVDAGYRGPYAKYETYGGYWKATVSHNTVGLGNPYGYNRLDGRFEEHVKTHGKEFRYEKEQNNIGRKDTRLKAFGDVGSATIVSAKAKTYDFVTHQRSIVWFRSSSISVVYDRMESERENFYEWYLNPLGSFISKTKSSHTFGSDAAQISVHTVLPAKAEVDIVSQESQNAPPYYHPHRPDFKSNLAPWEKITLFVERVKAKTTDFFHVLLPTSGNESHTVENLGDKGLSVKSPQETIMVSAKNNSDKTLNADGIFGTVSLSEAGIQNFALHQGFSLTYKGELLVKSELKSAEWKDLYSAELTALVDINNRQASFSLNQDPGALSLVNHPPKIKEGEEPAIPLKIKITFKTDRAPKKVVLLRSDREMAKIEDNIFDSKAKLIGMHTGKSIFSTIETRARRVILPFEYDTETGTVSIVIGTGFNQITWE